MNKMRIFYGAITIIVAIFVYFSLSINANGMDSFSLIGTKYSDIQYDLGDNYTETETSEGRTTYSFLKKGNNLTQFAVKDDIIEVIEIYKVFYNAEEALITYTDFVLYTSAINRCKLLRAYNSTMEFIKDDIIIRIEQLPTNYGWLVKYTAFAK